MKVSAAAGLKSQRATQLLLAANISKAVSVLIRRGVEVERVGGARIARAISPGTCRRISEGEGKR